jgi:hypothetical protein
LKLWLWKWREFSPNHMRMRGSKLEAIMQYHEA